MALRPTLRWVLLALAGLAVAIAVAIAAGRLTSERIGLASEPLRAGEQLAPAPTERVRPPRANADGHAAGRGPGEEPTTTPTTVPVPTTTVPTTPSSADGSQAEEGEGDDD